MKKLIATLLLLPLIPLTYSVATAQNAPQGDAAKGKANWEDRACMNCHGGVGEGAFGPDLAGRGLSFAQFKKAVHEPWGIMPAFPQFTDQELADFTAYFASLPKVATPGKWRFEVPANATPGQSLAYNLGCVQCHGPFLNGPRDDFGAVDADMNWFRGQVFDHVNQVQLHRRSLGNPEPRPNMGNFNRNRIHDAQLTEIYNWIKNDLKFRVPMRGRLSAGTPAANGVTYKLDVDNYGMPGKGLTAEEITVRVQIPAGATVVSTTGAGYQGVKMDNEAKAQFAEWTIARLGPKQVQNYTITLSRAGTQQDNVRGQVRWGKPVVKGQNPWDQANIAPAPLS
jgi:mono/diheme cytochrome c family protein